MVYCGIVYFGGGVDYFAIAVLVGLFIVYLLLLGCCFILLLFAWVVVFTCGCLIVLFCCSVA